MIARFLPLVGTGSLIALVTLLGVKTVEVSKLELVQPETAPKPNTATPETAQARVIQKPAAYYSAITDRPLFEPSRRPYVPETAVHAPEPEPELVPKAPIIVAPQEIPAPTITLQGIMAGDEQNNALIGINGGAPTWVPQGGSVANWILTEVGNDWIEISRDARSIRVDLYK